MLQAIHYIGYRLYLRIYRQLDHDTCKGDNTKHINLPFFTHQVQFYSFTPINSPHNSPLYLHFYYICTQETKNV